MLWGIVPILDLVAGYRNYDLNNAANSSTWSNAYYTELGWGTVNLLGWAAFNFAGMTKIGMPFVRLTSVIELVSIYLVYDADSSVDSSSTNLALGAHTFNFVVSLFY